ncbi:exported protein, unknown function [Hepatocystis sp. ex Piliocolobus tephrosceles]|nr:exported protein, unknown function [Hepatocystis sp. ex Piliocolobus tephrosceles]
MFAIIYKIITVLFFTWTWTYNNKAYLANTWNARYGRLLAQYISLPETNDDLGIAQYDVLNKFCNYCEQDVISDGEQNVIFNDSSYKSEWEIEKYKKQKSIYLNNVKNELITLLTNRYESQIKYILQKNKNLQKKDLIEIYDLIKHVVPSEEYLKILNETYKLLKQKSKHNNDNAELYHNTIMHLMNTYFFLINNEKKFKKNLLHLETNHGQPIFKKDNIKFKKKYLNIFKLIGKINKQVKTMLLKQMIQTEINQNVNFLYKSDFKLFTYALFNPLLSSAFIIGIAFLGFSSLTFPLLSLPICASIHSIYKIIKTMDSVDQIIQGSALAKKKSFI